MVSTPYSPQSVAQRDIAFFSLLRGIENFLFSFCILYFSGGLVTTLFPDAETLGYDNPLSRILWYPIYIIIIGLGLRILPQVIRISAFNPILIACVLWCGFSMIWALDQSLSFRRSIALLVSTFFGLVLAARYSWNELIQRFALVFSILAVFSVFMAVFNPEKGIMHEIHVGAWRGLWSEKNYLGGQMSRGFIIMLCAFAMQPKRFWIWGPMGILCFALVILSTSKTALLISVTGLGTFLALRIFRRFPVLRIPVIYLIVAGALGFVILMLTIPDEMLALIGKERTLTGRTDIWDALIQSIKLKPILGHGYGVYWEDPLGPSYYTRLLLEWGVPSAHNGWIETWLSVGFVGVVMFATYYIVTFFLAFDRIKRGGVETYWVVISTLVFLMLSMSESAILQQNELGWVIFVMTSAKLWAFERPYWRDRVSYNYFRGH